MTEYEWADKNLIVHLPTELDHHSSRKLQEEIDGLLRSHAAMRVVFDFEKTEFMDSTGIGVILGRYKRMKERRGDVTLYGAGPRIQRLLRISGISRMIDCCSTKEQALM